MVIKERITGVKHFTATDLPFGADTICGREFSEEDYIITNGQYLDVTCEKCLEIVERDLKRRPPKKKISVKNTAFVL